MQHAMIYTGLHPGRNKPESSQALRLKVALAKKPN